MDHLLFALIFFVLSAGMVHSYRYYALHKNIVDQPNHRSSHTEDTVRGAGIVVVFIFGLVVIYNLFAGVFGFTELIFVIPAIIGVVGLLDDFYDLKIFSRMLAYGLALAIALGIFFISWKESGIDTSASTFHVYLFFFGLLLAGLWLINLYNFMDGINGIAGFESLFIFIAMLWLTPETVIDSTLMAVIAALCGFLCWNFPRARVFMGDSGSTMLGALVFCAGLYCWQAGLLTLASLLVLPAVFIADASYTLLRRMLSGQAWHQAHRSHAYQVLSRRWRSHTTVVVAVMVVNLFWLLPLAWLENTGVLAPAVVLLLAYLPLLACAHTVGAGATETPAH